MEVQSDAEHDEDDADLGKLLGEVRIGLEAGRVATDDDAGEEIADDGRESEPVGEVAEHKSRAQAAGQSQNELGVMHAEMIRGRKE